MLQVVGDGGSKVLRRRQPRSPIGPTGLIAMVLGCASTTEIPPAAHVPIASSSPSGLSLIWRNRELRPVGQPIAIGTVAVGIVTKDRKAFVVAIDAATGRTLWQQPLTPSRITPGEQISVTKLGNDKVAYLRPVVADTEDAKLVVADVQSGRDLAVSPDVLFTSPPIVCANGKDVCAIIRESPFRHAQRSQFRLDVITGESLVENTRILPGTRLINDTGLIDLGDRPGNTLGLLRNGTVQWLTPSSAAFPSGFSSDFGWSWHQYTEQHVIVGSLYGEPTTSDGESVRNLASGSAMAGLSERTGKVLWRDSGSNFHCHLDTDDHPVRCRERGMVLFQDSGDSTRDFDVTVEGFDPATGKTTWSVPLGAAKALSYSSRPAIAGVAQVILDGPTGPVMLDYATGHVEPPEPGATFWCMAPMRYELSPPYYASRDGWLGTRHGWEYERPGGDHASICDDRGRPATELPSIAATMAAGARIGNYAVIATSDGYLGFQAPPP